MRRASRAGVPDDMYYDGSSPSQGPSGPAINHSTSPRHVPPRKAVPSSSLPPFKDASSSDVAGVGGDDGVGDALLRTPLFDRARSQYLEKLVRLSKVQAHDPTHLYNDDTAANMAFEADKGTGAPEASSSSSSTAETASSRRCTTDYIAAPLPQDFVSRRDEILRVLEFDVPAGREYDSITIEYNAAGEVPQSTIDRCDALGAVLDYFEGLFSLPHNTERKAKTVALSDQLGGVHYYHNNAPFPWPLVQMAEFEFLVSARHEHGANTSNVLIVTGIPSLPRASDIQRFELLLQSMLRFHCPARMVHVVSTGQEGDASGAAPKDNGGRGSAGVAFIALASVEDLHKCRAVMDGFPWIHVNGNAGIGGGKPSVEITRWRAALFCDYRARFDPEKQVKIVKPKRPKSSKKRLSQTEYLSRDLMREISLTSTTIVDNKDPLDIGTRAVIAPNGGNNNLPMLDEGNADGCGAVQARGEQGKAKEILDSLKFILSQSDNPGNVKPAGFRGVDMARQFPALPEDVREAWDLAADKAVAYLISGDLWDYLRAEVRRNDILRRYTDSDEVHDLQDPIDVKPSEEIVASPSNVYSRLDSRGSAAPDPLSQLKNLSHLLDAVADQLEEHAAPENVPLEGSNAFSSNVRFYLSITDSICLSRNVAFVNMYRDAQSKLYHIQKSLRTKDNICKAMKEELVRANQRVDTLVGRQEDFQEILRQSNARFLELEDCLRVTGAALQAAQQQLTIQSEESERDIHVYERRIRVLERTNAELQSRINETTTRDEHIGNQSGTRGSHIAETTVSADPCAALRSVEETSIEALSFVSEERLCKAIASAECISTKLRLGLDECRKRRQRELEAERTQKESTSRSGGSALSTGTDALCCVCYDRPKSMLLLPCRHLCLCSECSLLDAVRACPICRSRIQNRIEVFS